MKKSKKFFLTGDQLVVALEILKFFKLNFLTILSKKSSRASKKEIRDKQVSNRVIQALDEVLGEGQARRMIYLTYPSPVPLAQFMLDNNQIFKLPYKFDVSVLVNGANVYSEVRQQIALHFLQAVRANKIDRSFLKLVRAAQQTE